MKTKKDLEQITIWLWDKVCSLALVISISITPARVVTLLRRPMFEELLEKKFFFFILFLSSFPNIGIPIESGYSGNDERIDFGWWNSSLRLQACSKLTKKRICMALGFSKLHQQVPLTKFLGTTKDVKRNKIVIFHIRQDNFWFTIL